MIGLADNTDPAPVLVLGLGNLLLGDDGIGLRLLDALSKEPLPQERGGAVDFVDGGTQGLALLGYLSAREAILVLDAIGLGDKPGTIHLLDRSKMEGIRMHKARTAHEGNALELFTVARMLGDDRAELRCVGVEPQDLTTGIGLSVPVEGAFDHALTEARLILREMVDRYVPCHSR
jgi:hydrogenase maturation protease